MTDDEAIQHLYVVFDEAARTWAEVRESHGPADKVALISIGDLLGSATDEQFPADVPIETVRDPRDLASTGVVVSEVCKRWSRDDARTVVTVDSLSEVLAYVSPKAAFRFVLLLARRFETIDARAYFLLVPDRHEDPTVATMATLFDAVVSNPEGTADLPQATDEEIAALAAQWRDGVGDRAGTDVSDPADVTQETFDLALEGSDEDETAPETADGPGETEASDEEIARLLGED